MTKITIPSASSAKTVKFHNEGQSEVGISIIGPLGYGSTGPLVSIGVNRDEFLKVVRAFGVTPEELKEPKISGREFVDGLPNGTVFRDKSTSTSNQTNTFVKIGSNQHRWVGGGRYYQDKDAQNIYTTQQVVLASRTEDDIEVIFPKN